MKETLTNYRMLGDQRMLFEPDDSTIRSNGNSDGIPWGRDVSAHQYRKFSDSQRLELKFLRNTILSVFDEPSTGKDIRNLGDIVSQYKDDPVAKKRALERFAVLFTSSYFGGEMPIEQRMNIIEESLEKANKYIAKFEDQSSGMLKSFISSVGINNEVQNTNNPIDLLLMCFSANASRKMRFEARRKLILADVALREMANSAREEKISNDVGAFMRFLNQNIWLGGSGITVPIEMISTHDPETYGCQHISYLSPLGNTYPEPFASLTFNRTTSVVSETSIEPYIEKPNTRYTPFKARVFKASNGELRWAVFDHREKGEVEKLVKMMRKNTKNPNLIDDASGFIIICENKKNIYEFIEQLQSKAIQQSFVFSMEEASDTIANDESYSALNQGSTTELECIKFHLIFNGRKIELMFHTSATYLDYRYKDGISWSEYEINRVFRTGLIQALYPRDIYQINFETLKSELIQNRRNDNRKVSFAAVPDARKKRTV